MTLSDFSVFREHCRAVIDTYDLSDEDEDKDEDEDEDEDEDKDKDEDIENNLVV